MLKWEQILNLLEESIAIGLDKKELARKVHCDSSTIDRWLSGKVIPMKSVWNNIHLQIKKLIDK